MSDAYRPRPVIGRVMGLAPGPSPWLWAWPAPQLGPVPARGGPAADPDDRRPDRGPRHSWTDRSGSAALIARYDGTRSPRRRSATGSIFATPAGPLPPEVLGMSWEDASGPEFDEAIGGSRPTTPGPPRRLLRTRDLTYSKSHVNLVRNKRLRRPDNPNRPGWSEPNGVPPPSTLPASVASVPEAVGCPLPAEPPIGASFVVGPNSAVSPWPAITVFRRIGSLETWTFRVQAAPKTRSAERVDSFGGPKRSSRRIDDGGRSTGAVSCAIRVSPGLALGLALSWWAVGTPQCRGPGGEPGRRGERGRWPSLCRPPAARDRSCSI